LNAIIKQFLLKFFNLIHSEAFLKDYYFGPHFAVDE